MKKSLFFVLLASLLSAEYLSNRSCRECHERIYDEYESSYHSKTYFNDELHRKVADEASGEKYDCGACHMPSATNLKAMEAGKMRPNPIHQEQRDAVSCFYCHQIAFVKKAHERNINVLARQAENYKPTLYGALENPDSSDKHDMAHSPIYAKYVCTGCHSHKRNTHDVVIFDAMGGKQDSTECIDCHMPYETGGVEKMDKRARGKHRSHTFAGIHDASMRAKGIDIALDAKDDVVLLTLRIKMPHALIIQAASMNYLRLEVVRNGRVVWSNFTESPEEDAQGTFVTEFVGQDGNPVAIPAFAYGYGFVNNLKAKERRTLRYRVPSLEKDDRIVASMYVLLAKPSCRTVLNLEDRSLQRPLLIKKAEITVK